MNELRRTVTSKWWLVGGGAAAAAVPLSFLLWRTPPGVAPPPANILPFLMVITVLIPAIAFGFGVAFLLFGRPLTQLAGAPRLASAAHLGVSWLLINWWPHSNFHRVASGWANLLLVDYFFHATVIVATFVVAVFYLKVVRERAMLGAPEVDARARTSSHAV